MAKVKNGCFKSIVTPYEDDDKDKSDIINKSIEGKFDFDLDINFDVNLSFSNICLCFCLSESPYFEMHDQKEIINWIEEGIIDKQDLLDKKIGINRKSMYIIRFLTLVIVFIITLIGPHNFRNMILYLFQSHENHHQDYFGLNHDSKTNHTIDYNYESYFYLFVFSFVMWFLVYLYSNMRTKMKSLIFVGFLIFTLVLTIVYIMIHKVGTA